MCTHPQMTMPISEYAKNPIAGEPLGITVGDEFFALETTDSASIGSHPYISTDIFGYTTHFLPG